VHRPTKRETLCVPDTSAPRVLLVEDEPSIRNALVIALEGAGHQVRGEQNGRELATVVEAFRPDLAILDVMLPGPDGLHLARTLRRGSDLPILFLTARDAVGARLEGFAAGADDYVVKPFVIEEILARVQALLRRSGRLRSAVLQVDDVVVDEATGEALRGTEPLELTATEFRLLAFLVRNRGRTLSKLQILTQVWGYEAYDPNLVEVHVSVLRRKLEAHGSRVIHTVRGQGYIVRPP